MSFALQPNPVKKLIKEGKTAFGIYVSIPSPMIIELAAEAGMDFVRIDAYHSPLDLYQTQHMIRAAEARGIIPIVRVHKDVQKIQSALEMGAMGVAVPDIATVEDARFAVNAARFMPVGERGMFSASRDSGYGAVASDAYAKWSNQEVELAIQIESAEGVANAEKILAQPGIDLVGSGRGDLSQSLGLTGQRNHPKVLAAEQRIYDVAKANGKAITVTLDPMAPNFTDSVQEWIAKKMDVIMLSIDIAILRKTFANIVAKARGK